ncbi:MAG: hypothetical protein CME62_15720 [Halobacteriovoraceae bacterium]|nr:hypothetical protein [Halobacteriovoraceae bacterium]
MQVINIPYRKQFKFLDAILLLDATSQVWDTGTRQQHHWGDVMSTRINIENNLLITGTYMSATDSKIENELITDAKISGCTYRNNTFRNVVFKNCNFQATDITNCNFIDCKFENCNFMFSKLRNCSLIACKFDSCHFCITNSLNCNYLACTFIHTEWDENFHLHSKFERCSLKSSQLPMKVKKISSWETVVSEYLMQAA